MSEQLVFDLPHRPALGAEDFLVSDCNEAAVRLVDAWPDWPGAVQVICGPAGCGKSHLANVWLLKSNAIRLERGDLAGLGPDKLDPVGAVVVEDLDRLEAEEQPLFHLFNLVREEGLTALITTRTSPAAWAVRLPALRSRLRALPVVAIGPPDAGLLRAVILKQFTDRQLDPDPHVIAYLARRMERSMGAVRELVAALDRAALASGRKITRHMAARVLQQLSASDDLSGAAS